MITEDWRYSNLARIQDYLKPTDSQKKMGLEGFAPTLMSLRQIGSVVVFADGEINQALSNTMGVSLDLVSAALAPEEHPILKFNFERTKGRHKLTPNGSKPVFIIYLANAGAQTYQVEIDINGECEIIEMFLSNSDDPEFTSVYCSFNVKPNSQLKHSIINHLGAKSRINHFLNNRQDRDSRAEFFNLSLAGEWSRFDCRHYLLEPGAKCSLAGLYLKSEAEFVDHCTKVIHEAPKTESFQLYKGVLGGNSRAIFNGKIKINKGCPEAKTNQLNRNLIVSKKAEAISRPQLEILTDNVKANHGMTIGNLNPEEMFYLMSRGLPEGQAHDLLADAFINDVTDQYVSPTILPMVRELIKTSWLPLRGAVK